MKQYHFISGLPRSGSTLLSAILKQNPAFFASMSGPVNGLLETLKREMGGSNEYSVFINDEQRIRIFKAVLDAYYGEEFNATTIFDTNRGWCASMHLLDKISPRSKVIACVRNVSWIIDSFERFAHKNPLQTPGIFENTPLNTIYHRVDQLAKGDGAVGYAYNALKQAFYGEYAHNLLVVQYKSMLQQPQAVMKKIYDFIEAEYFEHDFSQLDFSAETFDAKINTPGLHQVRKKLEGIERVSILPPELFLKFENDAFWLNPGLNTRGVQVV